VLRPFGNDAWKRVTDEEQISFVGTLQYSSPEALFRKEEDSLEGGYAPQAEKPQLIRAKIKPSVLIENLLKSNPFDEFDAGEIARNFNLNPKVALMVLGTLSNHHKVEKTAAGKYRFPTANPVAAAQ